MDWYANLGRQIYILNSHTTQTNIMHNLKRISVFAGLLSLALLGGGCANLISPGTDRIWEERVTLPATNHRALVLSEPLDWFSSENGNRYDIWLPQGEYHVEAEDKDYLYHKAPGRISLGKKSLFSERDSRTYEGGIFIAKISGSKYSSGAYVAHEDGHKLLLFYFDSRFTGQEGGRWRYSNE